jgi:ComF family protein
MFNYLLDLFFPKKCVGCNREGSYFCAGCIKEIGQKDLICPRCRRSAFGGLTHPICSRWYGLDGLWTFGAFHGSLRRAIQKLKYRYITEQAEILTDLVVDYLVRSQPIFLEQIIKSRGKDWAVTFVPLHWQRQNMRGFNQAELLAKKLSSKLGIPCLTLLKRTRNTHTQTSYDAQTRRTNIKNAFEIISSFQPLSSNLLLIDDVWTTGSTLQECCYVLKKNGIKKVWAVTIAR